MLALLDVAVALAVVRSAVDGAETLRMCIHRARASQMCAYVSPKPLGWYSLPKSKL